MPADVCKLPILTVAEADCLPIENPTMPCDCCSICCNREYGNCASMDRQMNNSEDTEIVAVEDVSAIEVINLKKLLYSAPPIYSI